MSYVGEELKGDEKESPGKPEEEAGGPSHVPNSTTKELCGLRQVSSCVNSEWGETR